jgi:hypothetical protein
MNSQPDFDGHQRLTRRRALAKTATIGLGATLAAGVGELFGGAQRASASAQTCAICLAYTFNLAPGKCGGPCPSGYYCFFNQYCAGHQTYLCCESTGIGPTMGCVTPC